jgi:hypothetical protein
VGISRTKIVWSNLMRSAPSVLCILVARPTFWETISVQKRAYCLIPFAAGHFLVELERIHPRASCRLLLPTSPFPGLSRRGPSWVHFNQKFINSFLHWTVGYSKLHIFLRVYHNSPVVVSRPFLLTFWSSFRDQDLEQLIEFSLSRSTIVVRLCFQKLIKFNRKNH